LVCLLKNNSSQQDKFPPRIFKKLAGEILRAISNSFLRTQERWLYYKRLRNSKCSVPMEEEELDSYRETAEQIMTRFHQTKNSKQDLSQRHMKLI